MRLKSPPRRLCGSGRGPQGCGPSTSGLDVVLDEAQTAQLFQRTVDALFVYMAVKESPDLGSRQFFRGSVEIDGGVEEEAGTCPAVVPYGQGGLKMTDFDEGAARAASWKASNSLLRRSMSVSVGR
jgi:hypothetical protein